MFTKPAVYLIEHVPSGRVYVGGAANLSKRWSRHRTDLRTGRHSNARLQAAWDADGPAALRWVALAVVPRGLLLWYEQRALDHFTHTGRLLNIEPVAGARPVRYREGPPGSRVRAGDRCRHGHIIDGSRTERRKRRDGSTLTTITCQECNLLAMRVARGIPAEWPKGRNYHRPGGGHYDDPDDIPDTTRRRRATRTAG